MKSSPFKSCFFVALATQSLHSFGAEALQQPVTVRVQNTFTLTAEPNKLNFGTIRAAVDTTGGSQATYTVFPNGSPPQVTQGANATITEISPGNAADFTISGAAPGVNLQIMPIPAVNLANSSASGSEPAKFIVEDFEFYVTTTGETPTSYTTASPNLITASDGTAAFSLGATLKTDNSSTVTDDYINGNYTGTYNIYVNY